MSKTSLGDRIKGYESVYRHTLTGRTPVIIRLDGKAFHTLTRNAEKPFDKCMMDAMVESAKDTMAKIQGAKVAYVQSDECSIALMDYDDVNTTGWFNYNQSKLESISAAMMSVRFAYHYSLVNGCEVFDSRAFNVPVVDLVNTFLWRSQDWNRNSLQMYCRSKFSHNQLKNKNKQDMHNMLHEIGCNWTTDLTKQERNGTFLIKSGKDIIERHDVLPSYESIKYVINGVFDYKN